MTTNALQVGPFELHEVIGRGGMGDVWRATHVRQGLEVAVKVLTSSRARKARAIAAFRNEVFAMARLDHPGIVMVLDVGEVPPSTAKLAAGALTAGSPYLAMELATHGTLSRVREGIHWRRLRAVLLSILDALAHAHARGVIHRDLKPGNVLTTASATGKPVLKLADFGLAEAVGGRSKRSKRKISGTPKFMAPEQIEGRFIDQGPWTDLYALGCLGHWLATGRPPFDGERDEVFSGHLFEPPPPLPDFDGPSEFQTWLHRLLAKRPEERYRCAADAAHGLVLIADPHDDAGGPGPGLGEISDSRWTEPELSVLDQTVIIDRSRSTRGGSVTSGPISGLSATVSDLAPQNRPRPLATGHAEHPRPPIPADWRRVARRERSMRLIGAGLGLYGLRPIPLVDREDERTALWDALREVHEQVAARAVIMVGSAGSGKSRLAEWISERALEVGAALCLRASHSNEAGPGDGLARMLGDFLACVGLSHGETLERIRAFYFASGAVDRQDVYDCSALAEMISPAAGEGDNAIRFTTPTERYVVIARFLERASRERPLVVWLDDVQWGLDALDFVRFFLSTGRRTPVLIVMTAREEALVEDALESKQLLAIADAPGTSVLDVSPLDVEHHAVLVEELLSLEPELAAAVAQRTAGNPLFAVQLVGDWVQRGILHASDEGFNVAENASVALPDDIHDLWLERVEGLRTQHRLSGEQVETIELAALLGTEIDQLEWTVAAEILQGAAPSRGVVDALVEDGLAQRRRRGFVFTHGMLQESLARIAREQFRAARHHRSIAQMLQNQYGNERPDALERLGTHLFEAGDWQRSLEPLLGAAAAFEELSDFERAKRIVGLRDRALTAMGMTEGDRRRAQGWHIVIRCLLREGLVDTAAEWIERGTAAAEEDWGALGAEFELHRGSLARKRGDSDGAIQQYQKAFETFADDQVAGRAKCLYGIGEVLLYRGEIESAIDYLERALAVMIEHALPERGVVLTGLASAMIRLDDFKTAIERLAEAISQFKMLGNRGGQAAALNMLGELERARGKMLLAEQAYMEAIGVLESIGSRGVTIPRLNLGLVYLAREKWPDARASFSLGMDELLEIGERSHLGFVHLGLACAAAGEGNWHRFDAELGAAVDNLNESAWVDRDIAHHAELAAQLCHEAGETDRAQQAATLAQQQWDALAEGS